MRIAIAGATGLVGTQLTAAARAAGHEVLELSRSTGHDLTAGPAPDLAGYDAVVDVTQGSSIEQDVATAFFEAVGTTLATTAATRKVVLSIIGVDELPGEGYYAAKLAHERAYGADDDVHVVRAAQFHEFPAQMLQWMRDGDVVTIPDQPIQPVAVGAVVDALLAVATGAEPRRLVEVAGPRPERLPDLVARIAPDELDVVVVPVSDGVAAGALRPNAGAILAGPDYDAWRAATVGA